MAVAQLTSICCCGIEPIARTTALSFVLFALFAGNCITPRNAHLPAAAFAALVHAANVSRSFI